MRPKLYIAGPITAPTSEQVERNVDRAVEAGYVAWEKGWAPFIPHLNTRFDRWAKERGKSFEWKDYLEWDRHFFDLCDAMLFLAPSPGANLERQWAIERGMPIFETLEALPEVAHDPART